MISILRVLYGLAAERNPDMVGVDDVSLIIWALDRSRFLA